MGQRGRALGPTLVRMNVPAGDGSVAKLLGGAGIYAVTLVAEDVAHAAAARMAASRPMAPAEFRPRPALEQRSGFPQQRARSTISRSDAAAPAGASDKLPSRKLSDFAQGQRTADNLAAGLLEPTRRAETFRHHAALLGAFNSKNGEQDALAVIEAVAMLLG